MRTFGGKFPAILPKQHSNCRVTFCERTVFQSKVFHYFFFGKWVTRSQISDEIVSAWLYKLLSTYPNRKKILSKILSKTLGRKLCLWNNLSVSYTVGFKAKHYQFFFNEFLAGFSKLLSKCPQEHFREGSLYEKKSFFTEKLFGIWT